MPKWSYEITLEGDSDLSQWLNENGLSKSSGAKKSAGRIKQYYQCSRVKREKCGFQAYVVSYDDKPEKDVYLAGTHIHNHKSPISKAAKRVLENCDSSKIAPKNARILLEKEGLGKISAVQHYNFISYVRSKAGTSPSGPNYTTVDFQRYCDSYLPHGRIIGEHDLVIPIYDSSPNRLHCFMTTRHMLEIACLRGFLQIDATYKVIWQDYPVIMVGTSDFERRFHPVGLSPIWSDESSDAINAIMAAVKHSVSHVINKDLVVNSIMADGSAAITKSSSTIFPLAQRLMCWTHVERACQRHRSLLKDTCWANVKKDLVHLQLAMTPDVFFSAATTLIAKLNYYGLEQFATYFESTWVRGLPYWFEGAARTFPSTNNGLESFNNLLKNECTNRERLSLSRFLDSARDTLQRWSRESAEKGFSFQPVHPRQALIDGWSYYTEKPNIIDLKDSFLMQPSHYMYAVESSNSTMAFQSFIDHLKAPRFGTFDEYKSFLGSWYIVDNFYGAFTCTCHAGSKEMSCKHIIAIKITFHGFTVPDNCQAVSLKGKRKKGRPAKVADALSYH